MNYCDYGMHLTKKELICILDNIIGNVFVVDGTGKLIFQNPKGAEVLGFKREELLGKTVYELLESGITKRSLTAEAIKTGQRVVGLALSNDEFDLATISNPVYDKDNNMSMVVTYSQDTSLMNMFVETINKEKQENVKYRSVLEYLGSEKSRNTKIIVANPKMKDVYNTINLVAKTDSTIIIYGETGVGKEVVANYIHKNSLRSKEPLIPINCGSIPKELMESEFFGYEKGAFTDANKAGKAGLFELANKGTLFLDEIAELPMDVQSKLLRVLENGEVKRLGSVENPKCVDVRIIAATNKDLQKMVDEKLFREDLFYRINVIPVTLPPLRERVEEIPLFANMFLEVFNKKYGQTKCFSQKLMKNLVEYQWPGNVRELKNIIERLSLTSKSDILDYEDGLINNEIKNEGLKEEKEMKTYFSDTFDKSNTLQEVMSEYEEMYIKHILEQCEGNVANASKKMGIHRSVLYRKLKKISEVD